MKTAPKITFEVESVERFIKLFKNTSRTVENHHKSKLIKV